MTTRMQQRRGTALEWLSINPVLTLGEYGFESDTKKFKVGNGINTWTDLPYYLNEDQLPDVAAIVAAAQLEISTQVQTLVATSVATAISGLVDSSPAALDTLNELAAAIADDATFANTITNALANKADLVHTHIKTDITDFTHTHAYADLTGIPTTFTPSTHTHAYSDLTEIPSLFAPTAHTHNATDIVNTIKAISTATYSTISSDSGKTLVLNPATTITITVDNVLTEGQRIDFYLRGNSATFTAGSGVVLEGAGVTGVNLTMSNKYTPSSLICVASGVYAIVGNVGA